MIVLLKRFLLGFAVILVVVAAIILCIYKNANFLLLAIAGVLVIILCVLIGELIEMFLE